MPKIVSRWVLALFFVLAGANHFRVPELYVAMIPPSFPRPEVLSALAGTFEILGGIGLLVAGARRFAGWGLIALLVAVFPANLHVARMGHMEGFDFSATVLWLRLPLQAVLIAGVAWVALIRDRSLRI